MYKTSNKSNKKKRIIERLEPKYFIIRNSLIGESKKKKKKKKNTKHRTTTVSYLNFKFNFSFLLLYFSFTLLLLSLSFFLNRNFSSSGLYYKFTWPNNSFHQSLSPSLRLVFPQATEFLFNFNRRDDINLGKNVMFYACNKVISRSLLLIIKYLIWFLFFISFIFPPSILLSLLIHWLINSDQILLHILCNFFSRFLPAVTITFIIWMAFLDSTSNYLFISFSNKE